MKLDICTKYFYNNKKCFIECYYINNTIKCDNLYNFINKCFNNSCLTNYESYDIIINKNCTNFNSCNEDYYDENIFRIIVIDLICISMSICLVYNIYYIYKKCKNRNNELLIAE